MVLPGAVDLEITAGIPLLLKAATLQQRDGRLVVRQTGRLDAMQRKFVEAKLHDSAEGVGHVALAGVAFSDPVPHGARHGHPPTHVAERQSANQYPLISGEYKEGIGPVV